MVTRLTSVALFCLLAAVASPGQAQDSDSQTLKQILSELRAIHDDMRTGTTAQLILAQLELQQGVVNNATEDLDKAQAKFNDIHMSEQHIAKELDDFDEKLGAAANPDEQNALTQAMERDKSNLTELKTAEQSSNASVEEMQQRLRNAQDKLAGIESDLNSALARFGSVSKEAGQR